MTRPKRPRGTGSLYQLPNGYWRGLYRVTNESGKRVPQYVGDWDYDAAEAKLDALVGGVKLPANLVELRGVKAAAWDEGFEAVTDNAYPSDWIVDIPPTNPHR